MSHWSTGTAVIRDLALLERVAKRMGVVVKDQKTFNSSWAGTAPCVKALHKDGGVAGVVKAQKEGEYQIQMDNYSNRLCDTIGPSGGVLMRDYMIETVKEQAGMMGGTIISQEVDERGYTELIINVA